MLSRDFESSKSISAHLSNEQWLQHPYKCTEAQITAKKAAYQCQTMLRSLCLSLERSFSTPAQSHAMDLAQEKGAMSWLTSLPKPYNQSPVNFSLEPLPSQKTSQKTTQGWILEKVAFGGRLLQMVPSLTFESLTLITHPTATPSLPTTETIKTQKSEPMNSMLG